MVREGNLCLTKSPQRPWRTQERVQITDYDVRNRGSKDRIFFRVASHGAEKFNYPTGTWQRVTRHEDENIRVPFQKRF